ncbi:hypothetical protein NG895_04145 [Aeoliella sp. ICT_H6.2]|uniref:Uncharacterized protein n=1 Tax=Aeoliella straminimaris TaxID=2954799 RepID=A0A9X2F7M1_9BACT|nr:hypothetical protein [Aeoliella straminimaris]MCO6043087.1 hypothetical protein [Aeoliella straminimaris]
MQSDMEAYRERYGPLPEDPMQFARDLYRAGLVCSDIAVLMQVHFGYGSDDTVERYVNPERERKRKQYAAEKYREAKALALAMYAEGQTIEQIEQAMPSKWFAEQVRKWIK